MHNQRIALIISAIVGIIATFLPFIKLWFNSISLMESGDGTGYIIIAAYTISIIISLLGTPKNAMRKGHLASSIIIGIIPGILLLLFVISRAHDDLARLFTSLSIGFYLEIIVSIAILIIGFVFLEDESSKPNTLQGDELFCTGCGKKYLKLSEGLFCEECGNKL